MTNLEEVRARFARDPGLPFADALTEPSILDALDEHGVTYRDRVFSPVTTIWGFLSQVLSEDHSCRDTVSRIIAHRAATSRLESRGVAISMDGRGRALDNVFVERLWRTVKYEEVYLKDYENAWQAETSLREYFEFYCYDRRHQGLDNRTPAEVYGAQPPTRRG